MSSGPRPTASTSGSYALRQPRSCRRIDSSKSSVTERSGNPPTETSAERRKTTLVPQQNIAPRPSLPRAIAVVQQPHPRLGPAQPRRGRHRRLDHRERLVVGGDQDVDGGARPELGPRRAHAFVRARPPEADRLEEVEGLGGDEDGEQG